MAEPQYLGNNCDDGVIIGLTSSDKIAVLGGTPSAQIAVSTSIITSSALTGAAGAIWGFASQSQADSIVRVVNQLRAAFISFGWLS